MTGLVKTETKLLLSWLHFLILCLCVVLGFLYAANRPTGTWMALYDIAEPMFPLLIAATFLPLILSDQHKRTLTLVAATVSSLRSIFLRRLSINLEFMALCLVLLWLPLYLSFGGDSALGLGVNNVSNWSQYWPSGWPGGENGLLAFVLTIGGPAIFLGALGTLFAHLTADFRTGYLMVFSLWMFSRLAGLQLETSEYWWFVHLGSRSAGTSDWVTTKLVQLGIGFACFALSTWILVRSERSLFTAR